MTDLRAEQILDAVKTNLTNLATTNKNVNRGRIYKYEDAGLPALNIVMGDDQIIDELVSGLFNWQLQVIIIVTIKTIDELETRLNKIRKEVHVALMADYTQGLSFVIDTAPSTATRPELTGEGEKPTASQQLEFLITYRTSRADPSA